MRGPPVVLTNTLGRPVTNVISERGAVPMTVVNTLGEPVTLVASGGEPVTLFNANGTLWDYPFSLFANNEQGAWYDPSDFSTLFQNSTGTTPVTAVEQPVRLMLDRSGRGNHATAPNDASRPVLRSRYNLLTFSEQFDNAGWTKQRTTVTANAVTAPDGTTTADTLLETADSGSHGTYQAISKAASSTTYALSSYVKPNGRTWTILQLDSAGEVNHIRVWFNLSGSGTVGSNASAGSGFSFVSASIQALADGWYCCTAVITSDANASATSHIRTATGDTVVSYTGDITKGLYIWGAQILSAADQTSTGGAYQRIAAATDYDTSNPVWRPYLAFDGSDDSLSTSAIDFSGTDEMTVFAGLTKLSDAARSIVTELGTGNGRFTLQAPTASLNDINFASQGTLSQSAGHGVAAPVTRTVTGLADISADVVSLRANGVLVSSSSGDQGTGNFANAALSIGQRIGDTLRFNGRIYGLTVLGRTATASEIDAMEAWVNGKTGGY